MNILVTGSNGFIGSHLVPKLEELGHRLNKMDVKNDKWDDVRKYSQCRFATLGVDCVVHLAAQIDVQESMNRPVWYNQNNADGTLNLLQACVENKVKRFIFASSAAADLPQSPYGATKLCGEIWCDIFQKCYGLSTVSLRFFNVYGRGTDKGVIPTWIRAIKKGERPVIYGGNQIRDFIYVDDVVRAIICAMDKNTYDVNGVFEVGTGKGIAIFDLAQELLEVMKSDLKIIPKERKDGEIQESIAKDTERTLDYLGFKAKYTLEQRLKEMLK